MPADRTLAEVVAEGRALEAAGKAQPQLSDQLAFSEVLTLFYAVHGPRLLAVAEAAMEAERLLRHALDESRGAGGNVEALWIMQSAARGALAAFDAAAVAREEEGSNG